MSTIVQFRRGSHTYMSGEGSQLVLEEGEAFLEYPDAGINTPGSKIKIGDGVSKYCDLPYFSSDTDSGILERIAFLEENYAVSEQGREGG